MRYFPQDAIPDRQPCWSAVYSTEKGTSYEIEDTELSECPASFISADAAEFVSIINRAELIKETHGASFFGGDLNQWPSVLVDAVAAYQDEKGKEHNAHMEALMREREQK